MGEDTLSKAIRLLELVIQNINAGPTYWGDYFDQDEYNEIASFLNEQTGSDWELSEADSGDL